MKLTYYEESPTTNSSVHTVVRSILNVASPQRASGIFAVQGQ
jgi:hypothetical protein